MARWQLPAGENLELPVRHVACPVVILLATVLSLPTWAGDDIPVRQAILRDGQRFAARLRGVDPDWQLQLDLNGQPRSVPAAQLVVWGRLVGPRSIPVVMLRDGGMLAADFVAVASGMLHAESDVWGRVQIPRDLCQGAVLLPPGDPQACEQLLARLGDLRGAEDLVLLENGDQMAGTIVDQVSPGPSSDRPPLRLWLGAAEQPVEIPWQRVRALAFSPTLAAPRTAATGQVLVGTRDGSCLRVDNLALTDEGLQMRLAGGPVLYLAPPELWRGPQKRLAAEAIWEYLDLVQPLSGNGVGYLSDRQPLDYKHVPWLRQSWTYGRDRSLQGGRIWVADQWYPKGLAMHSLSRLAYAVAPDDAMFQAELAISDDAGRGGSVICRVYVYLPAAPSAPDTLPAAGWQLAWESPVVRGGDPPLPVQVDLAQARQLALIVDFADRGDQLDRAVWLNARLVRRPR